MIQAGWMLVVLVCACLAYRRVGRDTASEKRLNDIEEKFSAWPDPEELLAQMDKLTADLDAVTKTGATLPAVVSRANDITKDMLAVKTVVAEHTEALALLRSKGSLGRMAGRVGD